jgi:hypothetical protein
MDIPARKPKPETPFGINEADEMHKLLRDLELKELRQICLNARALPPPEKLPKLIPKIVDYSPHLRFIRHQGAWGCGMFAQVACWDIMNDLACPYSPNLSVNRLLWGFLREQGFKEPIPGLKGDTYQNQNQYAVKVGCPTESSEFTDTEGVRNPTFLGNSEVANFRMKENAWKPGEPVYKQVNVDLDSLRNYLTEHPLRAVIPNNSGGQDHMVALIGYNDNDQCFKLVNSLGDTYGEGGYFYISYADLNKEILAADYFEFVPPDPMPVARIRFMAAHRQDVYVWLANETHTCAKRVWPNGQPQDGSMSLSITVTLPYNFQWPPTDNFPLHLELFSTTEAYCAGGYIYEFTAAYGDEILPCKRLAQGPVPFEPYTLTKLKIP